MTVFILAISNLLFAIAILAYFYFREIKQREDLVARIDGFYTKVIHHMNANITEYNSTLKAISESKDRLFQQTLTEYLKHNEKLEKMILPQPVTRKAVQDVLDHMPETVPNDIEKDDKELEKEQLEDLLSRIPISKETRVLFEGDSLPEEVISDSGKFEESGLT